MSRVDDALKRARATGVDVPEAAPPDLHAVASPVVPAWQYERFPVEGAPVHSRELSVSAGTEDATSPAGALGADETHGASPLAIRHATRGVAPQFAEKIVGGTS